ncbi:MAG: Lrp/AsnC family transcriptional regulator [Candidatus Woesearchaeota archaeon]
MKITKKDLMIITELRRNARETLTRLSRKTRIPISTIFDRLKLQEGELIKKHCALIDFQKIGFSIRANILIKVPVEQRNRLVEHLQKELHINTVLRINNGYDFLVEALFRTLKEAEGFVNKLEEEYKIEDKKVFYVIDEIKREEFLSSPVFADMLF